MKPHEIDDPRDRWAHARRIELVRYAHELGHNDIVEAMPHSLIVKRLKALRVPPPNVPDRKIGSSPRASDTFPNSHKSAPRPQAQEKPHETVDADEILERDFQKQQAPPTYHEMRAAIKQRGVTLNRRWNKSDIEAIYNGEDISKFNK